MRRLVLLAAIVASAPACLVLNVTPLYDDETITWEPALIGSWLDEDDKSSIQIDRGEWKSYTIRYAHPVETGQVTGYLTAVGDDRFLDVMPSRGQDRGAFLLPVHAVLRLRLEGDQLELTPLSYDWMADRLRAGGAVTGLQVAFDQKENVLIVSPTGTIRSWIRQKTYDSPVFGASAKFVRIRQAIPAGRE
jgi:hypothetical protein